MTVKEVTMIELTEEQRQQLANGQAVEGSDPRTAQCYVILRKDVYEKSRYPLEDYSDWTEDELQLHLARSARENGWEEPGLEACDHYDGEFQKRWL
jgi:hypothetical protein